MISKRIPSYRLHKPSGQAVVTLCGKDHYLGRYDTPDSHSRYDMLIAEWIANGRSTPQAAATSREPERISIAELLVRYFTHADGYYRDKNHEPTREIECIRDAVKPLAKLFGRLPANDFSPKRLKTVRESMIERGLARTTINNRVQRIKRVFKWATEEELISPSVYHGLRAVAGLRRHRSSAPEPRPILPVNRERVDAILGIVAPQVAAMIELQWLTGMRPGEVVIMRKEDLTCDSPVWLYRPTKHKTEHHGHVREIPLGPKAQEVLQPWLQRDSGFLFRADEAASVLTERKRTKASRAKAAETKARVEKAAKGRQPRSCYDTHSYGRAIQRACDRAGIKRWSPNQLRHAAATRFRALSGLEATRVILGHRSADVTEIYAEVDRTSARDAMRKFG